MTAVAVDPRVALAAELVGDLRLRYCPYAPTLRQEEFLLEQALEAFFGGAAGPGKSWGLLMAALQYVDVAGYHAILLRPTLNEFEQPGGLMQVAEEWLGPTDAAWHGGNREWTFPGGATLRFGYLSNVGDLRRYKGPSYSFVGFDELTSFGHNDRLYRGMFRVLRQPKDRLVGVPVRMRSASNPGDIGHSWVKARFVETATRHDGAVFVRATIHDNPHLDYDEYLQTLAHLSPIDRMRLIEGDWDVTEEGDVFDRSKIPLVSAAQVDRPVGACRYWDLAATRPSQANTDPDWTVGVRLELAGSGVWTIRHIVRLRDNADAVEQTIRRAAEEDGPGIGVWLEQEPAAAGKSLMSHYQRNVLRGYACHPGLVNGGNKEVRARPVAAAVGNGHVQIVDTAGPVQEFLDTLAIFPHGIHDDDVDALSGAHTALARGGGGRATAHVPRGRIPGVAANVDRRARMGV